ncbi:ABC transporter substrate-binding protein [Desulfovibrio ferrophilus]|nr:ABC transporter substrate-binding protein [Desulfovibrio ferrophilus]
MIARQLGEVGIDARVSVWERRDMLAAVLKGDRAAYLTDWGSAYFDPFDLAVPKLMTGGRGNFSGYSNGYVDALLEQGGGAPSKVVRQQSYQEAQRIIQDQTPWIFGYTLLRFDGVSNLVKGYRPSMDGRINLHDVELTNGEELVVGVGDTRFLSFDPAAFRSRNSETLIRNMFDGLVTRTPEGVVVPELAESWVRVGALEYIFTLSTGAVFHDGTPVTAHDVAFTFDRILNPYGVGGRPSPRKGLLGPLVRVTALDDYNVKFVLDRPFSVFLQALVHFQIVPKAYFKRVGDEFAAKHPIGSGPFRYVSGNFDSEVIMERFDRYYGGSPALEPVGPAKIRRVVFRLIPVADERIEMLLRGQVHITQEVPFNRLPEINQNDSVRAEPVEGTRSYQIELNNARPPFNDIRLRKAVTYAVDWQEILAKVYGGYGDRLATCFLESGFGYDELLRPISHDSRAAKLLLEAMGYDTTPVQ